MCLSINEAFLSNNGPTKYDKNPLKHRAENQSKWKHMKSGIQDNDIIIPENLNSKEVEMNNAEFN